MILSIKTEYKWQVLSHIGENDTRTHFLALDHVQTKHVILRFPFRIYIWAQSPGYGWALIGLVGP